MSHFKWVNLELIYEKDGTLLRYLPVEGKLVPMSSVSGNILDLALWGHDYWAQIINGMAVSYIEKVRTVRLLVPVRSK